MARALQDPEAPAGPAPRPSRAAYISHTLLWVMRLGIMAMLAVIFAVLLQRYRLTDEQKELVRYVEVEVVALGRVEAPVYQRMEELLAGDWQRGPVLRQAIQDELMPQLVQLRRSAQVPREGAKTRMVQVLSEEYLQVIERLIDVGRAVLQAIDEPTRTGADVGRARVQQALFQAATARQRWKEHVQMAARAEGLAK